MDDILPSIMDKLFFLVSLPYQSHINPALRLANRLISAGARVTFVTTVNALNKIKASPTVDGLSYDSFSDGYDDDATAAARPDYMRQVTSVGPIGLKNLLQKEGQKPDLLIYGLCLPWVAGVAREFHLPSAFFFIQSAAAFSVVYHFCKNDGGVLKENVELTGTLKLPGLPSFEYGEIPSFLVPPAGADMTTTNLFQEHIQTLDEHPNPLMIINTFEALEEESLKPLSDHINIFSVGPLVPDGTEKSVAFNLYADPDRENYLRWLDSKPEKSVVYLSFGSLVEFNKKQKEEMLQGLIEAGHPFLWVIRNQGEEDEEGKSNVSEKDGLIIGWCSQVEVLNHPAIGCYVTHCGWNSTVESMVSGVALVGCPQFAEQKMNMKMVEEVWGNGVKAVADGEGVVGREEIKRCVEVVMGGGEKGQEIRTNSEKWKRAAKEAVVEGGSSHTSLKRLVGLKNE